MQTTEHDHNTDQFRQQAADRQRHHDHGGKASSPQTNNCSAVVGAGQSCAINVTFKTGTLRGFQPGTYTGTVMITDNGGGGFQTRAFVGDDSPLS